MTKGDDITFSNVIKGRVEASDETDEVLRQLDEKFEPRIQALRESQRLNESDFTIRINAL